MYFVLHIAVSSRVRACGTHMAEMHGLTGWESLQKRPHFTCVEKRALFLNVSLVSPKSVADADRPIPPVCSVTAVNNPLHFIMASRFRGLCCNVLVLVLYCDCLHALPTKLQGANDAGVEGRSSSASIGDWIIPPSRAAPNPDSSRPANTVIVSDTLADLSQTFSNASEALQHQLRNASSSLQEQLHVIHSKFVEDISSAMRPQEETNNTTTESTL